MIGLFHPDTRYAARAVGAVLLFALLVLSACASRPTQPVTYSPQVEVFSWWTGGGEAAGLDAMIRVFRSEYPQVEFRPTPLRIAGRGMPGRN